MAKRKRIIEVVAEGPEALAYAKRMLDDIGIVGMSFEVEKKEAEEIYALFVANARPAGVEVRAEASRSGKVRAEASRSGNILRITSSGVAAVASPAPVRRFKAKHRTSPHPQEGEDHSPIDLEELELLGLLPKANPPLGFATKKGARPCACRDCREPAYGQPGSICYECADAGCASEPGFPNIRCKAVTAFGERYAPYEGRFQAER